MTETKKESAAVAKLAAEVDRLDAEIGELKGQRDQATAQLRSAERLFEELEERRGVLSPKTFAGDEEAVRELQEVEDEHDRIARSARVARSALPEFDRMLKEAKEKLEEAEKDVHSEKAAELLREGEALDAERDELGKRLFEVLRKQEDLYFGAHSEVRYYDGDQANRMYVSGDGVREWLEAKFERWLRR